MNSNLNVTLDLKALFRSNVNTNENYLSQLEIDEEFIRFGRSEHQLKLVKSNAVSSRHALFKLVAFTHTIERNLSVQYSSESDRYV